MSTLKTNAIQTTGGKPLLHSTGSILQVVSTHKGDWFQTNSTDWTDITGLTCSIQPSNSGNKILVWCSMGAASTRQSNMDHGNGIRTYRQIGGGSWSTDNKCNGVGTGGREPATYKGNGWSYNSDHNPGGLGFHALDNPSTTSNVTYKIQVKCQSSSYRFTLNGNDNNGSGSQVYRCRHMTSLTLMEVSA